MSADPKETSEQLILKNKKSVDRSVRTLMTEMEHENTLLAEPPTGILQRALKIFRGVRPVLTVLGSLPLIPSTWRAGLVMFTQALDALVIAAPAITNQFKAGKDL